MPANDGGLGNHLVGDRIQMGQRTMDVTKLLGEGEWIFKKLMKMARAFLMLTSRLYFRWIFVRLPSQRAQG